MNSNFARTPLKKQEIALIVAPLLVGGCIYVGLKLRTPVPTPTPQMGIVAPPGAAAGPAKTTVIKGRITSENVAAMAFSPDGKTLATGDWGGRVKFWDAGKGKLLKKLEFDPRLRGTVTQVRFSPDGKVLAVNFESSFVLFDGRTGKVKHALQQSKRIFKGLAFSPDSRLVAVATRQQMMPVAQFYS
ncbi:hypothetical protein EON80_22350, partial [bacterium]